MSKSLSIAVVGSLAITTAALGSQPKQSKDESVPTTAQSEASIRHLLAATLNRCVKDDGITRVLEDIGSTDRSRIEKDLDRSKEDDYGADARRVRESWKSRIGTEFAPLDDSSFTKPFNIKVQDDGNRADVDVPSFGGRGAFTIHVRREHGDVWRFEVPDSVNGRNFESTMLQGIRLFETKVKDLPTGDLASAYDVAAAEMLHVLAYSR
jgi:hypothetical protein